MCLGSNISVDEVLINKISKFNNISASEILEVIIDRELNWNSHVKYICQKTGNKEVPGKKLNALTRRVNPF